MTPRTLLPFRRTGDRRRSARLGSRAFRLALPAAALPVATPLVFPPAAFAASQTAGTTYVVQPGDTLSAVAVRLGTDVDALARLNRLANPDVLLAGTSLLLPPRRRPTRPPSRPVVVTYTVKPGDTIWDIATKTGTTMAAILEANHLSQNARIRPGQVLRLPGAHLPAAPERPRPKPPAPPAVYLVIPGDTLTGIAARYRISVDALLRANRLAVDSIIHPGQKLVLPGVPAKSRPRPAAPPTHGYVVRRGDTLTGIALAAHAPLTTVMALNHLSASDVIVPGQHLLLPGPAPKASSPRGDTAPARTATAAGETAGEEQSSTAGDAGPPSDPAAMSVTPVVRKAAAANRAALATRPSPDHRKVRAMITATARRYGVDPSLALGIAEQESGFEQRRVSGANAIGVMQVIPSSGRWAAALVGRPLDLLDARDNIVAGVAILAALRAAAPEHVAVAAYYQGLGSVRAHGMYADTRRYVANVLTLRERYRPVGAHRP
jgi:LysM repeat protein